MKKIPLVSIGVQRDGKTMYPEIGKPFDFTVNELADLDNLAATTKDDYYRDPVNEVAAAPAPAPAPAPTGSANDARIKTIEVITSLLENADNLNGDGNLKMDVLTEALKAVDLPKISAADRDALVAEIKNEI